MSKLTLPRALVLIVFVIASVVFFLWARQEGEAKASRAASRAALTNQEGKRRTPAKDEPDVDNADEDVERVEDGQPEPATGSNTEQKPRRFPARRVEKSERATGLVRLAAELLREFPNLPDELRRRCDVRDRGAAVDIACRDGVDALVDYELAKDGTWATLAILGPHQTNDRMACRDWLVRNAPGAKPFGTRQKNDELQMYFVRGKTRFVASFLTLPRHDSGVLCSVMACIEDGKGNGSACREPVD